MSPTGCKLKTRRHHGSTRKKFGRPSSWSTVLKEVKVMSRLTDSGGQADRTSRLSGEGSRVSRRLRPGRRRSVKRERTRRIAEARRRETFKVNTQTECITKRTRAYCRAKGCAKCNRSHHTLLQRHGQRRATRAGSANESAVSETVTNIGTDDGATVTLLDDSVASHINAKGPRAELKLISARGHQISDRNSRRIKIKVRGPNGVGTRHPVSHDHATRSAVAVTHGGRDLQPSPPEWSATWRRFVTPGRCSSARTIGNSSPAATSGVEIREQMGTGLLWKKDDPRFPDNYNGAENG
ncbi:hypothetical protein EVAR_83025_1 [Eumeta japonica]|uniref:Uncharacterized protein n=1 Tax=Eumeta variegata TaxID=151549 RepID=A0A4C1SUW9_EUMVA|nr:hypothetical protein EVAR_83025_1 [Eumeta japonica]